jgi:hypothetical protein
MTANTITTTASETVCREFAAQFPTANVLRGIALCESGRITWAQLEGLCTSALADALQTVR